MHSDSDSDPNDPDTLTLELHNDSTVYFDAHTDSLFCLSAHPLRPAQIVATGSGDDSAWVWAVPDTWPGGAGATPSPDGSTAIVRPASARQLQKLDGHTDSVVGVVFTRNFIVTGGLDGRVRFWRESGGAGWDGMKKYRAKHPRVWTCIGESREVEEIVWVSERPVDAEGSGEDEIIAVGANDGSVWVYGLTKEGKKGGSFQVLEAMYKHTASCTAGTWSEDGKFLATVSEDGGLAVWDYELRKDVVSLSSADARFRGTDGAGWFSVAISPEGPGAKVVVVGGGDGECRVVALPRGGTGGGAVIASMHAHTSSVETLSFSRGPPGGQLHLLASAGVDGRIVFYDIARGYAIRRVVEHAHSVIDEPRNPAPTITTAAPAITPATIAAAPSTATATPTSQQSPAQEEEEMDETVVQISFLPGTLTLTSCGADGCVKRWDARTGALLDVKRGHQSGSLVLGFVQTGEVLGFNTEAREAAEAVAGQGARWGRIVSAGDDGVGLVFDVL